MVVHVDMTQLSVASPRLRKLHRNGWTCVFDHIQVPHYATIKAMIHLQYVMWCHVHIMYISCITHTCTHMYMHIYIYICISINKYIYIYTCINGFLLPNTIFSPGYPRKIVYTAPGGTPCSFVQTSAWRLAGGITALVRAVWGWGKKKGGPLWPFDS